jgi:hypothetical protein
LLGQRRGDKVIGDLQSKSEHKFQAPDVTIPDEDDMTLKALADRIEEVLARGKSTDKTLEPGPATWSGYSPSE